ncbi:MAG TPA: lamin tail domain-containing protein [Gracilimonas sp.]|nr:lamin tail domain-containing protein [Gracilimonas sp.]
MRERISLLASIICIAVCGDLLAQVTTNDAWINEIHYDNAGGDTGEFVEVVIKNASEYTLGDITVSLYNGADGAVYNSESLNNFEPGSTVGDYSFYYWQPASIQNGPDGIALDHQGTLIQFISYEGIVDATEGPADAMSSEDINVSETGSSSSPIGHSLQITGTGYAYTDLIWSGPDVDSPGDINTGQYLYPILEFQATADSASETEISTDIGVTISNPNGLPLSVDVEFQQSTSSAEGSDFIGSLTQTITFGTAASEGDVRNATFSLNNDSDFEGIEKAVFVLANISSAGMVEVVGQSEFTLNIEDDETPNVVINEIHADPDASNGDADGNGVVSADDDEFIEIVNAETISVDITGWTISDAQGVKHTFSEDSILPANGAAVVFGGSNASGHFGGAIVQDASSLGLNNGGDTVTLADNSGNAVDTYAYNSEGGDNQSLVRLPDITGNFVKHSEVTESSGTLFSPGTRSDGTVFSASIVLEGTAGWRMLSAPVENMPMSELTDDVPIQGIGTSDDKNFYIGYDGNAFTAPADLSGALNSGEGFILYAFNNNEFNSNTLPVIVDVGTNSEPSSDVSVTLHANGDRWNLLGNPYQTAFDVTSMTPNNGVLGSSVGHIWSNTDGSYILTSSNDDKVAPGQGYFILNDDTSPATSVTLPLSGKSTGTKFYKSPENKGFVQLALISESKTDGSIQKDLSTVLYFHELAVTETDRFDSDKLYPLKSTYSILGFRDPETEAFKAQESRSYFGEGEEVVHLDIQAVNVVASQTIKWEKSDNIPEDWELLFIDNQSGEQIVMDKDFTYTFDHLSDMRSKSIETVDLTFPVTVNMTNNEPRFTIKLSRGTSTSNQNDIDIPKQFYLRQNYPNPFNPSTKIQYDIAKQSRVSIEVFNLMGQRVATLIDKVRSPGSYHATWNASAQASGVYYYRLKAGNTVMTRKMMLIK